MAGDMFKIIGQLIQWQPAVVTAVAILIAGYLWKVATPLRNDVIPFVVVLLGALVYSVLVDIPTVSGWAFVQYYFIAVVLGAAIGLLVWLYHAQIWLRIKSKISMTENTDNKPN